MNTSNLRGMFNLYLIDLLRGTSISKILNELRKDQYLPEEQLNQKRESRFNYLFNTARTSTKYYAKYNSYEELPILTKDRVRKNFQDLISSEYKKKLYTKGTGGSTGLPLIYYTTVEAQSYLWAGIILSWETAGFQLGDKVAFVAGSSLIKSSWKHKVFYKLLNIKMYSAFSLNDENIKEYVSDIKSSKTRLIYGYATALDLMATYINKRAPGSFPHLKGIVSSAEMLTETMRQNIEKAFGVKVYNQYGCNEAGISAFECEHQKLHLISSRAKYETDSNGKLISTDLANKAFIIIKYANDDIVEFSEEACACKRSFPVIEKVVGRSNDIIVDADNKITHASFFQIMFRNDESIRQYQVLFDQHSITVNLKVDELKQEEDFLPYINMVRKHFKFDDYKLVMNGPFLKSENAKHKHVIDNRNKILVA